jgi:hypothetical protein
MIDTNLLPAVENPDSGAGHRRAANSGHCVGHASFLFAFVFGE